MKQKKQARQAIKAVKKLSTFGIVGLITLVVAIVTAFINLLLPSYQLMQSVVDKQTAYEIRIHNLEEQISQLEEALTTSNLSNEIIGEVDYDEG